MRSPQFSQQKVFQTIICRRSLSCSLIILWCLVDIVFHRRNETNATIQAQAKQQFEAQKKKEEMSEAEKEELAVRKRREEGTPVTDATFAEWWEKFTAEMEEKKEDEQSASAEDKDKAAKKKEYEERPTGFQIFSDKAGVFNLEKLEAAAQEMENDTSALDPEELGDVDEDLFDDDDDLDDLDFDDEDDEEIDSDEEPDI